MCFLPRASCWQYSQLSAVPTLTALSWDTVAKQGIYRIRVCHGGCKLPVPKVSKKISNRTIPLEVNFPKTQVIREVRDSFYKTAERLHSHFSSYGLQCSPCQQQPCIAIVVLVWHGRAKLMSFTPDRDNSSDLADRSDWMTRMWLMNISERLEKEEASMADNDSANTFFPPGNRTAGIGQMPAALQHSLFKGHVLPVNFYIQMVESDIGRRTGTPALELRPTPDGWCPSLQKCKYGTAKLR
ncbi:hypothetical protein A6R68_09167 [Neotoma lepida]|uniref:Uncharacterized protein n=1 Tax=Neotoma lepida TaxID=56216 RepID=A0A1A6G0J1_NEOLE|nr:hypothetical protein A6R68_09167 [Neotoma lepida]